MAELRGQVHGQLREHLLRRGASPAFQDPALFDEVVRMLSAGAERAGSDVLLLPELLGAPETWRLHTAMRYQSHRAPGTGSLLILIKRRIMMPVFRWLFLYSRDNFERQRRVNDVLFSCVQELALEVARLRQELRHPPAGGAPTSADA